MHPRRSAQDVMLCHGCKTTLLQSHCELCNISLCKACVEEHLSDFTKLHKAVPFLQHVQRKPNLNYPKCQKHAEKHCELHCEKCDIPVCITCVSSGKHRGHDTSDFLEKLGAKTQSLQTDLEELETKIYPRYEKMTFDVELEKSYLETKYGNLITTADQHGEILHREVTTINQRKSAIKEMKNKHLSTLNKNKKRIAKKITELNHIISNLKSILESNNVSLTSTYKSRNSEFRSLPPKVRVTLPNFSPGKINKDQLNEMFGSLSTLSFNTEYSTINSPILDELRLTATIDTGYRQVYSVSCLREEKVWTRGNGDIMKLLNLQGELLASVETKSGKEPWDITVTREGDLVYTDNKNINLVKNNQVQTVFTLHGWEPLNVCSTSSGDLLVTIISNDRKQSKVVRFSGSRRTQTIQFDDQGRPLYSSGYYTKYISENRNLDICVADNGASAVVVVNQSGKLRFRYTGHPSNSKKSFTPVGITTDSHGHILAADWYNQRIHILDQDGQFLRYIYNLSYPFGLCVDIRDNLFVAEWGTAKVRKIQYL